MLIPADARCYFWCALFGEIAFSPLLEIVVGAILRKFYFDALLFDIITTAEEVWVGATGGLAFRCAPGFAFG